MTIRTYIPRGTFSGEKFNNPHLFEVWKLLLDFFSRLFAAVWLVEIFRRLKSLTSQLLDTKPEPNEVAHISNSGHKENRAFGLYLKGQKIN